MSELRFIGFEDFRIRGTDSSGGVVRARTYKRAWQRTVGVEMELSPKIFLTLRVHGVIYFVSVSYISVMFIKVSLVFLLFLGFVDCYGQDGGDFCDAISVITRDAPNRFRNIRGKEQDSGPSGIIWDCGIKPPGVMASRFVVSMGLFYEGAFFQAKNKDELKEAYNKYKELLSSCLTPQGYKMSMQDNFSPGLGDYKKVVFIKDATEDVKVANIPAHIAMEATYNKEIGKYTVVMYIFEH